MEVVNNYVIIISVLVVDGVEIVELVDPVIGANDGWVEPADDVVVIPNVAIVDVDPVHYSCSSNGCTSCFNDG